MNTALIQTIQNAFPKSYQKPLLSHEECCSYREWLIALYRETFEEVLPQVLVDFVSHYGGTADDSCEAGYLINLLNVEGFRKLTELGADSKDIQKGEDNIKYLFANFNRPMILALIDFLQEMRTWSSIDYYIEDIDSAIEYWQKQMVRGTVLPNDSSPCQPV